MSGAIDVCNFDASWGGGPTEWRRVAALASAFAVEMGHHEEPQISAHLLAAIPNRTYLESFHPDRDPMFYRLVANRSPLKTDSMTCRQGQVSDWSSTRTRSETVAYNETNKAHREGSAMTEPTSLRGRERERQRSQR